MTPPIPQAKRGLDFVLPDFVDFGGPFISRRGLFSPDRIKPAPHSGQRITFPAEAASSISKAAPHEGHGIWFSDMVHPGSIMEKLMSSSLLNQVTNPAPGLPLIL